MEDARLMGGAEQRLVMAERKANVAAAVAKGLTLRQAAEACGITFGQAKAAYRAVIREFEASYLKDAKRHRARLIYHNRQTQAELWRAYEKVREQGTISRKGRVTITGTPASEAEVTQSTDPGAEAKFLLGILKAQEQEAKLLGLDKAEEEAKAGDINIRQGIVVMNNAKLGPSEWVRSLPRAFAEQGKGIVEVPASEAPVPDSGTDEPKEGTE
jgi:hypothetical protein